MDNSFDELAIKQLLTRVKVYRRDIGQYKNFKIAPNFDYHVQLDNGKIVFKFNDLKNDATNVLSPIQLTTIANRFIGDQSQNRVNQVNTNNGGSTISSLFKKLFK